MTFEIVFLSNSCLPELFPSLYLRPLYILPLTANRCSPNFQNYKVLIECLAHELHSTHICVHRHMGSSSNVDSGKINSLISYYFRAFELPCTSSKYLLLLYMQKYRLHMRIMYTHKPLDVYLICLGL